MDFGQHAVIEEDRQCECPAERAGTQYTPRTLTESVVEHALEPLVYTGPAEGQPPEAAKTVEAPLRRRAEAAWIGVCGPAQGRGGNS
jgi:hypothetical protein